MTKHKTLKRVALATVILATIGLATWYFLKPKNTNALPDEDETLKDVFDNLSFETGKAIIKPESFPFLDELAMILMKRPTWKLTITGHTDDVGSQAINLKLSKARSESVKKYLVQKGAKAENITTDGKGESMPIVPNNSPENRAKNRRVEFVIIKA